MCPQWPMSFWCAWVAIAQGAWARLLQLNLSFTTKTEFFSLIYLRGKELLLCIDLLLLSGRHLLQLSQSHVHAWSGHLQETKTQRHKARVSEKEFTEAVKLVFLSLTLHTQTNCYQQKLACLDKFSHYFTRSKKPFQSSPHPIFHPSIWGSFNTVPSRFHAPGISCKTFR